MAKIFRATKSLHWNVTQGKKKGTRKTFISSLFRQGYNETRKKVESVLPCKCSWLEFQGGSHEEQQLTSCPKDATFGAPSMVKCGKVLLLNMMSCVDKHDCRVQVSNWKKFFVCLSIFWGRRETDWGRFALQPRGGSRGRVRGGPRDALAPLLERKKSLTGLWALSHTHTQRSLERSGKLF